MISHGTSTPDIRRVDPQDGEAEQFAAALDGRGDDWGEGSAEGGPDLAREVRLARRLGALGSALDPEPQARQRARLRLLAALSREAGTADDGPSRAS